MRGKIDTKNDFNVTPQKKTTVIQSHAVNQLPVLSCLCEYRTLVGASCDDKDDSTYSDVCWEARSTVNEVLPEEPGTGGFQKYF